LRDRSASAATLIARRILLSLAAFFIAAVAVRIPQPARPGLDAAWSLALSVAHTNGLVFGRDIAFTFGPLGYLISGIPTAAVVADIARFSAIVAIVYALLAMVALRAPMSITQRIVLAIALLCLAASPSGEDYLLLFAFLAGLGARSMRTPHHRVRSAFILGTIAGVAAMTKFTLAIDCGGAGALFYLGSLAVAPARTRPSWIVAALTFAATFGAAALASFAPTPLAIGFAGLAFAFGIAAWSVPRRQLPLALAGCALAAAGIGLASPALIDFARVSLAVATDYSSAMSLPGSSDTLRLAIGEFILIALVVIALAREGNLGLAAALGFALFGGFKHGFVRQDGHVFYFAITAAAVGTIAYAALRRPRARQFSLVAAVIALVGLFSGTQSAIGVNVLAGAAPSSLGDKIAFLLSVPALERTLSATNATALAGETLATASAARFGRSPVDVEPVNATLAIASGLNWRPVPSLQAYSAYDGAIDALNVASIEHRPRGFVLYSLGAIDSRYPFGDSPQMLHALACRYRADPPPVGTAEAGMAVVLTGPNPDRCSGSTRASLPSAAFDESIDIPHAPRDPSELVLITIRTKYTLIGRIRKSLFRIGDLFLTARYEDGSLQKFRIIPEAAALGMIIDPSPHTFAESQAFFAGKLLPNVRSISVSTDVPATFAPTFEVSIVREHRGA
jgi:hypothetical protein